MNDNKIAYWGIIGIMFAWIAFLVFVSIPVSIHWYKIVVSYWFPA